MVRQKKLLSTVSLDHPVFMIECQLATGSESSQLGGEQQHQLSHLLLHWKGALLADKISIIFLILLLDLSFWNTSFM